MYVARTSEAWYGPPKVIAYTKSNNKNAFVTACIITTNEIFLINGIVTKRIVAKTDAPSILAASIKSYGTACKPAPNNKIENPKSLQI